MKEETEYRPKPLVAIGNRPILWHIMKIYAHHGFNEFVVALGYKGQMIKDYFLNYQTHGRDFTLNTARSAIQFHDNAQDDFTITFVDTGEESETGERIRRCRPYLGNEEFMVTYGDGVADINIKELAAFHKKQGTIGTITGARPHSKYGFVAMDENGKRVTKFYEKPPMQDSIVNSGFMVFKPDVFNYLDHGMLEATTLPRLAEGSNLSLYVHNGFWKAMDTHKEMEELNQLWQECKPWKVWE